MHNIVISYLTWWMGVQCSCASQVQQAVVAMRHNQLFTSFKGWTANAAQAKALRSRLYDAIRMWMLRFLGSAFAGWSERTALKRSARELCAGMANTFLARWHRS
jgi:hypothetical protein